MSRSRSHSFTVTFRVVVTLPDVVDIPGPALSEQNLANPDKSVDAAMDDLLARDASPEILHQAQRCLLAYIGWLVDDAPARHPSWELQRALRRLVEVQAAAKTARAKLH
jgi:hypothetical protein